MGFENSRCLRIGFYLFQNNARECRHILYNGIKGINIKKGKEMKLIVNRAQ
ncbi:hypothetical protein SedNR2807_08250 [Citrobacter sedlakii]